MEEKIVKLFPQEGAHDEDLATRLANAEEMLREVIEELKTGRLQAFAVAGVVLDGSPLPSTKLWAWSSPAMSAHMWMAICRLKRIFAQMIDV